MDELNTSPAIPLRQATLTDMPSRISVPQYDRAALRPGIVHIGLGNFHRAHQAWYLHRLMQQGLAQNWAIIGAGVRPNDAVMRQKLLAQDCLTTLIELSPDGLSAEITGSIIDFLPVEDGYSALIDQLADATTRIVSLTVTEGGYFRNVATGGLDVEHPDIVHDASNLDHPRTAFGAILAALSRRRATGVGPFTILSCDNLQGNGTITRDTIVSLAKMVDPFLAEWIDVSCSFPNSMVDCIVPATGPTEIAHAAALGIIDAAPVTHENFRQWVIEDTFCSGRPDWDKAGATFTKDVHAYETMKIRVLNAGHQVLANAGELLSIDTVSNCMTHPDLVTFFRKVQTDEILPHVAALPEMTPGDYLRLIERRFSNPAIQDTTRRVAFDGSSRHSGFVVPIIRDAVNSGGSIRGLALVEALWARMCFGLREDGSVIEPNDPNWDALQTVAKVARDVPQAWLAQRSFYGGIGQDDRFAKEFADWLRLIWNLGTQEALRRYGQ